MLGGSAPAAPALHPEAVPKLGDDVSELELDVVYHHGCNIRDDLRVGPCAERGERVSSGNWMQKDLLAAVVGVVLEAVTRKTSE